LLLIALSIHGLFAGIAIGITTDNREVIDLTIAILLHKWAEAMTLGISLAKSD